MACNEPVLCASRSAVGAVDLPKQSHAQGQSLQGAMIFDADGKKHTGHRQINNLSTWVFLTPTKGPWQVYINAYAGQGKRFSLQGYAPHGSMKIKEMECSYKDFLDKI
ncbi:Capn9 [Symbiodinium natans]|uniref:Capn9 protein n=1 Tax=Symbiodinium natans TaxID=878477 RepID=A0A812TSK9_9DINO|nr:Capn9 [Symbiodinium natans]